MSTNRVTRSFALCLLVVTGAFLTACPKKPTTPDEPPVEVKQELEVLRVTPGTGRTDQATSVTITGSAFPQGARVVVGDTVANDVSVASATEIRATIPAGLEPGSYDVVVSNPDPNATKKEARLRGGFNVTPPPRPQTDTTNVQCDLAIIYFDFDMSSLSDDARSTLQKNVDCIKRKNARRVKVEGHTDERGSTDYNLALGQRRADEVKRYLTQLGVANVDSISYGEERPATSGTDESAWGQNRRAEIVISE